MTEKRMPVAERQQETGTRWLAPPPVVPDNWPDIGPVSGLERVLTRSGEPVKRKMTEIPEPKDKLDAATEVVVSGLEDDASGSSRRRRRGTFRGSAGDHIAAARWHHSSS
jgi:hypothetical protein